MARTLNWIYQIQFHAIHSVVSRVLNDRPNVCSENYKRESIRKHLNTKQNTNTHNTRTQTKTLRLLFLDCFVLFPILLGYFCYLFEWQVFFLFISIKRSLPLKFHNVRANRIKSNRDMVHPKKQKIIWRCCCCCCFRSRK